MLGFAQKNREKSTHATTHTQTRDAHGTGKAALRRTGTVDTAGPRRLFEHHSSLINGEGADTAMVCACLVLPLPSRMVFSSSMCPMPSKSDGQEFLQAFLFQL